MYDLEQLNKDLSMIVRHLGKRTQRGFYSVGFYEDDVIQIVDSYVDPAGPEIYLKVKPNRGDRLNKPLSTESLVGSRILSLVVSLEDE